MSPHRLSSVPLPRSLVLVASLWLVAPVSADSKQPSAARPNLVVFLADDAGWGDYGFSGNRQATTPNIDSIAQQGVSLDRFFVCPVCAPTRAEFLTGRYHPRGGVRGVSTGQERLDLTESTIAEAFKRSGYATGAFGKWHNGSQWPYHPMARGFDEYLGHTAGHWGEYFDPPLDDGGKMVRTRGYIVDVCTDRALDFIDRNQQRPFFCYIPFTTPHSPWAAPAADWNAYKDAEITQRAEQPDQEVVDETRCALAMLRNQDANVGRVLQKLKSLGIDQRTIIVYFSDNGPNSWRWNGGMKGRKGSTDEGGVRSVCYIRYPDQLPAGRVVPQIAGAIDLYPTLLGLVGVERTETMPLDGRDLTPLLRGRTEEWPDRIIFSTWAGKVSARTQQFRLDDQGELYDLVADPGQKQPVTEKYPDRVKELRAAVDHWRSEMFPREPRDASKPKGKRGDSVDPRPIPVGYREFPITLLPARDGTPLGGVRRSSSAPNCSYFVNWTQLDDRMEWSLDVHEGGRYEVTLDYTCPEKDVGSTIEVSVGSKRLQGKVEPAWDPPLYTNQDTLPRPAGESQMKEFKTLRLGELLLEPGVATLRLQAVKIPGQSVMDVRRVTLTLLTP